MARSSWCQVSSRLRPIAYVELPGVRTVPDCRFTTTVCGFELPLIFLVLLLPLLFSLTGKASLDYLIAQAYQRREHGRARSQSVHA